MSQKKTAAKAKTKTKADTRTKAGTKKISDPRTKVLLRALRDIPFDGWQEAVLAKAGKAEGLSAADTKKLFPAGIASLLDYFSFWADEQAIKGVSAATLEDMRIRDRIAALVSARITALMPHKESVKKALSSLSRTPQGLLLPKRVWRTADLLWHTAGDTATDYNHYTKRLLLSGVIVSTMLYWLNDDSEDTTKTWEFLEHRIENVLKIGKTLGRFTSRRSA